METFSEFLTRSEDNLPLYRLTDKSQRSLLSSGLRLACRHTWDLNWSCYRKLGPSLTSPCLSLRSAHDDSVAHLPLSSPYTRGCPDSTWKKALTICLSPSVSPPYNPFLLHVSFSLLPSPMHTCISPDSTEERSAGQLGTCSLSMPWKSLSLFLARKGAHVGHF